MYGHTLKMAEAVHQGVDSIDGVQGVLRRVAEFDAEEDLKIAMALGRRVAETTLKLRS